ncbi:MAG TPA: pantoate--beta-alanine ligase [Bacteroidales bacterium]|nr:pantoate--beta-alanine ligase [Bacteroidales bacterium]
MKILHKVKDIKTAIAELKAQNKTIGFVPTMGALHKGHYALFQKAKQNVNVVVGSIFVNPTQFNNADDLRKYPRNIEQDIAFIQDVCDIVFCPTIDEIYPMPPTDIYDFGQIDKVMEGKYRQGHFNGVAQVLKRLFEITTPDKVFFGKKDYQQAVIVKKLINMYTFPIQLVLVDTVREDNGLAFSSRNMLLSEDKREKAAFIYKTMLEAKALKTELSPKEIEQWIVKQFLQQFFLQLEYASIVDAETLMPFTHFNETKKSVLCIAAYIDNVRLIDNLEL